MKETTYNQNERKSRECKWINGSTHKTHGFELEWQEKELQFKIIQHVIPCPQLLIYSVKFIKFIINI